MGGMGFLAVGVGAALGAWLRWGFAVLWNAINPALPYGTLAANLVGLVRLEAVQREAVFVSVNGDSSNAEFVSGSKNPDGDFGPVGDEQFADVHVLVFFSVVSLKDHEGRAER